MFLSIVNFLVCKRNLNAHNSLLSARRGVLGHFVFLVFFISLEQKSDLYEYFLKFLNFGLAERTFVTIIFCYFPSRILALKFQIFRSKLLITFDLMPVDNNQNHN